MAIYVDNYLATTKIGVLSFCMYTGMDPRHRPGFSVKLFKITSTGWDKTVDLYTAGTNFLDNYTVLVVGL